MVELKDIHDSDSDYSPFNDGWNARISHKQLSDNPFGENNWKYSEWQDGWIEADKVIKEDKN